jgi:hypothetical protein
MVLTVLKNTNFDILKFDVLIISQSVSVSPPPFPDKKITAFEFFKIPFPVLDPSLATASFKP